MNTEDAVELVKKWLRLKGCTLWMDWTLTSESELQHAAEWVVTTMNSIQHFYEAGLAQSAR